MNQTQKNITKYKKRLPGLKEKLVAMGLTLAMVTSMLVTVSFAWISLSLNPEVKGANTSIASNGNLEIALATGTLADNTAPGSSQVGDGIKDTLERNATWGNLINLNDTRYGLKNLVLRPSLLNEANLTERPLYGPVYDSTGRVVDMNTNFGYSRWDSTMSRFKSTNELGVRAITSMTFGQSGDENKYNAKLSLAESANARYQSSYESLAENEDYMDALASMMTGYMVQNILKVNSSVGNMISDATIKVSDLKQLALMYESVISCFEQQAEVYATLLNLQAEISDDVDVTISAEEILGLSYSTTAKTAYNALKTKGYTTYADSDKTIGIIKEIDQFLADYALMKADLIRINGLIKHITDQNKTSISWPNCPTADNSTTRLIDDIINNLVNVGECTITGGDYTNLKIKSVGATAALALKDAGVCETKITNGILYRMDNRSGARIRNIEGKPLALSVQVMGTQTIRSNVSTSANDNYFENERAFVAKKINEKYGAPELIAKDSYGFAVDFWVRTNAASTYLTLQGNVLTRTDTVDVKGKDLNGKEVQLYTITVKLENESSDSQEGEGETEGSGGGLEDLMVVSYDVYESTYTPDGSTEEQDCWRFADSHQVVTEESLGNQAIPTPIKKVKQVETVIGYEGDNRVWEGDQHSLLTVSSTTQGSGSCYVFYAETPVDQDRSLELLKSMKVAFVDANGKLLASAYMDTERHYSSTGKVIVPLVLDSESINIGALDNGYTQYAITALEQNVATRITALVYLDGTTLTNDQVLAAADIEGQVNIQFGSSAALYPLNNEKLYNSELYAEVESITPDKFDYDTLEDGDKMTSTIKVRVTGTQPSTVTANFIRRINATQGSPEQTFTLTDTDGDGIWEGNYTFMYPGTYILRSVTLDGTEREIKLAEGEAFPSVVVNGFAIKSVNYSMNEFVMTDAQSYSGNVSLSFVSDNPEKMPDTVVGKFTRDDGAAVNVNFTYNPTLGSWQGTANFVSSGEYTMQYVVLDGQYVELAESMQKTVELTLGMRVRVETISPTTIFYGEESAPSALKMQVEILDNSGKAVANLAGASLTYSMTETETLYADLVWNSGEEYYEGEFSVESGTWRFKQVDIRLGTGQTNVLKNVNSDAPVFTVVPPTPPSFVATGGNEIQYVASSTDSATVTATLKDSGSATVYAKLVKDSGEVSYALGTLVSSSNETFNYIFNVPAGLWEFEGISAFGVFDSDQNYHAVPEAINDESYATGIIFDSSTTNGTFENITVAALYQSDISVSFTYPVNNADKTLTYGKDSSGKVTGTFMQQHTLAKNSVTVTINDSNNLISKGYFDISEVSLSYKYGSLKDQNGVSYGGYTGGEYVSGTEAKTFIFSSESNIKFALSNDVNFTYAAQYVPNVFSYKVTSAKNSQISSSISVNDSATFEKYNVYDVEVYSKTPTATITGITPTDSNNTKLTYETNRLGTPTFKASDAKTSSYSNYAATVYALAEVDNDGAQHHGTFTQPTLKISVSGIAEGYKAKLTLPAGSANQVVFERTGNGNITKTLGKTEIIKTIDQWALFGTLHHNLWAYYGHGTQTITTMTLTKDNLTYTVTLDNPIVITNPSSVNQS